jgi:hypothetical protein
LVSLRDLDCDESQHTKNAGRAPTW